MIVSYFSIIFFLPCFFSFFFSFYLCYPSNIPSRRCGWKRRQTNNKIFFLKKAFLFRKSLRKTIRLKVSVWIGRREKNLPVPNKTANSAASQTSEKNVEKRIKKEEEEKFQSASAHKGRRGHSPFTSINMAPANAHTIERNVWSKCCKRGKKDAEEKSEEEEIINK